MAEVIWSSNALTDLSEIGEYIEVDSPKYAELTVNKLYNKVEVLSMYPKMGRKVPETEKENLRELIEGNYRIIYEVGNVDIFILTVHHSSRPLKL
ncbi:type II toxin-antitoxin system RelE/ParE family toxin [Reichenbachiella ulvae]|uniref:Type II toxin-antitoxin system RelE/ParE family toxin n=1 Tax=Reichenbachiella ulvae TaxID=2980104 RepID=A0ABT3CZC1_9BACT|nr:type II toxin-antitoxin system RelE/ParE family toxin [Reichenbachiella ulvae]MCV9389050.1 type II toxin-antitoxin system RelE/ParE family toxin [Reichenbachiella ulvae]